MPSLPSILEEKIEQIENEVKNAIYTNLDELKMLLSHPIIPFTEMLENESVEENANLFPFENNDSNCESMEIKELSVSIVSEDIIEMPSQSSVYDVPSTDFKQPAPKVRRRGCPAKPVRIERNELEMARLPEHERKIKEMRLRNNESCRKTRRKIQRETQELLEECVILKSTNKKLKKIYMKKKSLHNVIVNEFKALL